MELGQLCTILGAAQSSNPQQRKAAEQTLLQVTNKSTVDGRCLPTPLSNTCSPSAQRRMSHQSW